MSNQGHRPPSATDALGALFDAVRSGRLDPETAAREGRAALAREAVEDLTFARVDHDRAVRQGFPEVVFGQGKTADQIAANGPLAVQAVLKSLRESADLTETEALANELEIGSPIFLTNDAKEGPTAFAEKRAPNFTGT